jgi:hypothetical protein
MKVNKSLSLREIAATTRLVSDVVCYPTVKLRSTVRLSWRCQQQDSVNRFIEPARNPPDSPLLAHTPKPEAGCTR